MLRVPLWTTSTSLTARRWPLRRSVIAPLERASAVPQAGAEADAEWAPTGHGVEEPARSRRERSWELGTEATVLRTSAGSSNELLEATAALQGLSHRFAFADDPDAADDRLAVGPIPSGYSAVKAAYCLYVP